MHSNVFFLSLIAYIYFHQFLASNCTHSLHFILYEAGVASTARITVGLSVSCPQQPQPDKPAVIITMLA